MNKLILAALLAAATVPALAASTAADAANPPKAASASPSYSATQTQTTVKVLGDGNEIATEQVTKVYQDSRGRMRRDKLDRNGDIERITITDTDRQTYVVDHRRRTVTVTPMMLVGGAGANTVVKFRGEGVTPERQEQMKAQVMTKRLTEQQREAKSLGERDIEGLVAKGTEFRHEVAADAAGNLRPIEIVSERWWSPDLKTFLFYRINDPRSGETVTALSGIERGEPDAALFEIPAGYRRVKQTYDVIPSR